MGQKLRSVTNALRPFANAFLALVTVIKQQFKKIAVIRQWFEKVAVRAKVRYVDDHYFDDVYNKHTYDGYTYKKTELYLDALRQLDAAVSSYNECAHEERTNKETDLYLDGLRELDAAVLASTVTPGKE